MIIVYDNMGESLDRYTIFPRAKTKNFRQYISASEDGMLGVYLHNEIPEGTQLRHSTSHNFLGKRIPFCYLGVHLQRLIKAEV